MSSVTVKSKEFLKSFILPLLNPGISPDILLEMILDCFGEFISKSHAADYYQYEFISVKELKCFSRPYLSRVNLFLTDEATINADQQNIPKNLKLLVGLLTNKPNVSESDAIDGDHLFLADTSGAVNVVPLHTSVCDVGKLVLIPEWTIIPCYTAKGCCISFIEIHNGVLDVLPERYSQNEHLLKLAGLHGPDVQISKNARRNEMLLHGVIIFLSPVHKIMGCDKFFMVTLDTGSVLVAGQDKMHWWDLLKPTQEITFVNVKNAIMNKGSSTEREIVTTTSRSSFIVTGIRDSEKSETESRSHGNMINYTGSVTDCKMADRGIFHLDDKFRLVLSHQPCVSFCRGLRVGTKIIAYNVHCLKFNKVIHLFCCTSSTIKIREFSPLLNVQRPFFALNSCFTRDCQSIRVKDYLVWLKVADNLVASIPLLSQEDAGILSKALLNDYLKSNPIKRNVFQEFFSEPHQCVISSRNYATLPVIFSPLNALNLVYDSYVASAKEFRQRQSADKSWCFGEQYDRLYVEAGDTQNDSLWAYKILHSENLNHLTIVGELVICNRTGMTQLKDSKGAIDVVLMPKLPKESHRQRVLQLTRKKNCILSLRRYCIVLERFGKVHKESQVYEIYILADPFESGNMCFVYNRDKGQRTSDHVLRNRKRRLAPDDREISPKKMKLVANLSRPTFGDGQDKNTNGMNEIAGNDRLKQGSKSALNDTSALSNAELMKKTSHPSSDVVHKAQEEETIETAIDDNLELGNCNNESDRKNTVMLRCQLAEKAKGQKGFSLSSNISNDSMFIVVFVKLVGLLNREGGKEKAYSSNVKATMIGELTRTSDECSGKTTCDDQTRICQDENDMPGIFTSLDNQEVDINLRICENLKWKYTQLAERGCFVFEVKRSGLPSPGNSIVYPINSGLRHDATFSAAEIKRDLLYVDDYAMATLPQSIVKMNDTLSKELYGNRVSETIRKTLFGKKPSSLDGRNVSFSGIIVSREFKVAAESPTDSKVVDKESTLSIFSGKRVTLILRIKDVNTADEMNVYLDPNQFVLTAGILPGVRMEFKGLQIHVSRTKNIYCIVTASSSLRPICFSDSDLNNIKERNIIATNAMSEASIAKLSKIASNESARLSNVTWQFKLDFTAVRWASISWKCNICLHKVSCFSCAPGCKKAWKLFCQMSVIVDDGTGEGYLQIEQDLLRNLLALPNGEWHSLRLAAKETEIVYQKGSENPMKRMNRQISDVPQRLSKQKAVQVKLWNLFQQFNTRGPYMVECRLFDKKSQSYPSDFDIRSIAFGNEEILVRMPKKINLQALRISKIDYAVETLRLINCVASS